MDGNSDDPEFDLQLLSASDPAARASMLRHTVAMRLLLTGNTVTALIRPAVNVRA